MPSTRFTLGTLLLAGLLAGCASQDGRDADTLAARPDSCDASRVQQLVGQPVSRELLDQAMQRAGAKTARALGPHDIVTLEYNSQRLNLLTDQQGVITRVSCG
ncbi:I78 family peptidase inhibitor [Zestomonas thermotolerans]|uniref:I78 family peptidase inhibitor n=1 Tax=Zestomonas thermotolerans TaxID=157784 RepID=UPI0023F1BA42|nr:I78 family peptidase inhibitor [Pseudomonas thermotolerans]